MVSNSNIEFSSKMLIVINLGKNPIRGGIPPNDINKILRINILSCDMCIVLFAWFIDNIFFLLNIKNIGEISDIYIKK